MKPIISVIIPAFNSEKSIEKCLKSVQNQTINNIEIIVINDGSTDDTINILERVSKNDCRIKVFDVKNGGQGKARNIGILNSNGKYLGFVDSDDFIESNMLEVLLNCIEQSQADLVQCNIFDVFEDGNYKIQLSNVEKIVEINNTQEYLENYVFKNIHSFECCNKLFNKQFLIKNNILFRDNQQVYAEDLLFNLEVVLKLNKIQFIKTPLYYYYQNNVSHSKTTYIYKSLKLCNLFDIIYNKTNEICIKRELSKIAVLIIFLNLSHILDSEDGYCVAYEVLRRKDIRKYVFDSLIQMKKLKHKLLMFLLFVLPIKLKLEIIKIYYGNLK